MRDFTSRYGRVLPPSVPVQTDMFDMSVEQFASLFHVAALGIKTDEALLQFEADRILKSGYQFQAFNVESAFLDRSAKLFGTAIQLMVPIGYPVGGMTLEKRAADMQYIVAHRADQCCVSINYAAALSGDYDTVYNEVKYLHDRFDENLHIIDIVPATLFSARELIAVCTAIKEGGGYHLKVNPGYGLGSTLEELLLLKRVFGDAFILDPSGGIRELRDVAAYVNRGFTVIHSQKTFGFIEEFKAMKEKGERFDA